MIVITTPYQLRAHKATKRALSMYIQSHGHHAGRPLRDPIANCFTLTCYNKKDLEHMWWTCEMLYRSNNYHTIIRGSVIPFITKNECRHMLDHALARIKQKPESFTKAIAVLTAIDTYLDLDKKRTKTLQDLQRNLLRQFM